MTAVDTTSSAEAESRTAAARDWPSYAVVAGTAVTALIALALGLSGSNEQGVVEQNAISSLTTFGLAVAFAVPGLILRRNRPENGVGWILVAFGLTVALSALAWAVSYVAGLPGGDVEVGRTVSWLGTTLTLPAWTFLTLTLFIVFPSGRPQSGRERWLLAAGLVTCLVAGVFAGLRPGSFLIYPAYTNPLALPGELAGSLRFLAVVAVLGAFGPLLLAGASMVERYRHAATVERLQLRWFAYAVGVALTGATVFIVVGVLLASDNVAVRETTYVLMILGVGALPVAVLQAIMRHRLYDIDTIIGRTFAYGALTAILAGLYAASLRGFNALFVAVTGQESEAALVLTTLVLATTFTPIKSRLERIAQERFTPAVPESEPPIESEPHAAPASAIDPDALAGLETRLAARLDASVDAAVRRAVGEALRDRHLQEAPTEETTADR